MYPILLFKLDMGIMSFWLSFGLTNAPTTLIDLINRLFKPYLGQYVVISIDDILVSFKSREEHKYHLSIVLQTLRDQ